MGEPEVPAGDSERIVPAVNVCLDHPHSARDSRRKKKGRGVSHSTWSKNLNYQERSLEWSTCLDRGGLGFLFLWTQLPCQTRWVRFPSSVISLAHARFKGHPKG